jgi:hypothetical protein
VLSALAASVAAAQSSNGVAAFLNSSAACVPELPALTPTPSGFAAVWVDGGHLFERRFDRNAAAAGPERVAGEGALRDRPAIVSESDGSAVVAWVDDLGDVFAEFVSPEGVAGEPLMLTTTQLAPDFEHGKELELVPLADDTFLLAMPDSPDATRFDSAGVLETIGLGQASEDVELLDLAGVLWHAWIDELPNGASRLELRERSYDGTPLAPARLFGTSPYEVELVAGRTNITIVWIEVDGVRLSQLQAGGPFLFGPSIAVSAPGVRAFQLALATDPTGNLLVTWEESPFDDVPRLMARTFLADGTPTSEPLHLRSALRTDSMISSVSVDSAVATVGAGVGIVAAANPVVECPNCLTHGPSRLLEATQRDLSQCSPPADQLIATRISLGGEHRLLLQEGRFVVDVVRDPRDGDPGGPAQAVPNTEQAGSFWFFDPENKEIEVKVLDGRAINGHYWVFAAGLTDLPFTVRVVDQIRSFINPHLSPAIRDYTVGGSPAERVIIDTTAFPAI